MHGTEDNTPPDVALGHETRDISTRVVVVFGASLIVGAIIIHVMIWLVYMYFGSVAGHAYPREYPLAKVGAPALPPAPRLQTKPREELKTLRRQEEEYLNSYGWVDANGGIAHIPIDEAMRRTVEQGLPARTAPPAGAPVGLPEVSSSGRTLAPPVR